MGNTVISTIKETLNGILMLYVWLYANHWSVAMAITIIYISNAINHHHIEKLRISISNLIKLKLDKYPIEKPIRDQSCGYNSEN